MRVYSCPAEYERFLERAIKRALHEIKLDQALRADEEPRVRALASVPDNEIDATATGLATIIVGVRSKNVRRRVALTRAG